MVTTVHQIDDALTELHYSPVRVISEELDLEVLSLKAIANSWN